MHWEYNALSLRAQYSREGERVNIMWGTVVYLLYILRVRNKNGASLARKNPPPCLQKSQAVVMYLGYKNC